MRKAVILKGDCIFISLRTLVLITIPPSAAKAVDGYVKPQIKQVVPE